MKQKSRLWNSVWVREPGALNVGKTNRPNITCNNISAFIKTNYAFPRIAFLRKQPNIAQTYSLTAERYQNATKRH